jgi:hypothetical protein
MQREISKSEHENHLLPDYSESSEWRLIKPKPAVITRSGQRRGNLLEEPSITGLLRCARNDRSATPVIARSVRDAAILQGLPSITG